MQPTPRPSLVKSRPQVEAYSPISVISKSMVATFVLFVFIVLAMQNVGVLAFGAQPSDSLSSQQTQDRLTAFNALPPMTLAVVPDDQVKGAVEGMGLTQSLQQTLMADLKRDAEMSPAASANPSAAPQPVAKPAVNENKLRLAWVSLWDTDAQDDDTVTIVSEGYTRTIILKKEKATFAIPVPADGVVHVTGVRDGDGGGITVGLSSGASVAVFPIMSEGETLGLKVAR